MNIKPATRDHKMGKTAFVEVKLEAVAKKEEWSQAVDKRSSKARPRHTNGMREERGPHRGNLLTGGRSRERAAGPSISEMLLKTTAPEQEEEEEKKEEGRKGRR